MAQLSEPDPRRIALVTGASRGIGVCVAGRLANDGFHVILTARASQSIEQSAVRIRDAGGTASAIACDVGDRAAIDMLMAQVAEEHGRLDVLVNNAGVLPTAAHAERVEIEDWDRTLEINLTAPWLLSVKAKELMNQGGVIVNVASTAAYYPSRGLVAYNVSKAGLVMLTRVLALEWARHGIRVVGIAPGKIDTDMLAPIIAFADKHRQELNPQRRAGDPDEVAALISYLVSSAAAYVTGVVVPIDGGELLVSSSETAK